MLRMEDNFYIKGFQFEIEFETKFSIYQEQYIADKELERSNYALQLLLE